MTTSSLSSPSSLELELWKNICRASAYYQRAQQQLSLSSNYEYNVDDNKNVLSVAKAATSSTPQSITNDDVGGVRQNQRTQAAIKDAEYAYKLYRSCHKHVMKIMSMSTTTSPGSVMFLEEDGEGSNAYSTPRNCSKQCIVHEGCGTQTTATTINLELRLAQTLRLLATLYASSSSNNSNNSRNYIGERNNSSDLEMAINYHDRAVSLLVGVFEEEEDEDEDKLKMGDTAEKKEEVVAVGRDRSSSITSLETPMATLIWENPFGGIADDAGVNDVM
jgi:hypothetical protein